MNVLDLSLPRQHQVPRIPLWVKLTYTLFRGYPRAVLPACYGPTNFLYYCDVALLMTLVAVWREDSLWASMPAVGILLPQSFWIADFLGRMIGLPVLRDDGVHVRLQVSRCSPGACRSFTSGCPCSWSGSCGELGYDRRAFRAWTVLAWGLMLVCYFLMPGPSASLSKAGVPVNINYVYGLSDTEPQHWMPPLAYLGLLLVALPLGVFLPTHLVLRSVFRPSSGPLLRPVAETAAATAPR